MSLEPALTEPPSAPAPSSSPAIDPDDTSLAYYSLLLAAPELASPTISALANKMLSVRIARNYEKEMNMLSGELRDEWKGRVAGVKGDFMARIVPQSDEEEDEEEEEVEGTEAAPTRKMVPTILSDADATAAMSKNVDALVETEFSSHLREAEGRVRSAVEKKETLEMEVFLGSLLLEARAESDDDDEVAAAVKEGLEFALESMGIDYEAVEKAQAQLGRKDHAADQEEPIPVQKGLDDLQLSN